MDRGENHVEDAAELYECSTGGRVRYIGKFLICIVVFRGKCVCPLIYILVSVL